MGNMPCCCKDDEPNVEVKVKDVYCCDNIQSSCCIKSEKKHHKHHKHHKHDIELQSKS
jgi:hypothetical protein